VEFSDSEKSKSVVGDTIFGENFGESDRPRFSAPDSAPRFSAPIQRPDSAPRKGAFERLKWWGKGQRVKGAKKGRKRAQKGKGYKRRKG
jgi:hypothetical protein